MNKNQYASISEQRNLVFETEGIVELISACGIGDGVISESELKTDKANEAFKNNSNSIAFFVPASGSGSRMFQFLFEYVNSGETSEDVTFFFNHLSEFAFYALLPINILEKVNQDNISVAKYILSEEGLNFGNKSKGLIEFHKWNNLLLTPFQEQLLQADKLFDGNGSVHFTIQENQKTEILNSVDSIKNELKHPIKVSYSVQSNDSNAYCFNDEQELVMDGDVPLRRPAGHGALLSNLNKLEAETILIKNIDNIQSMKNCDSSLNAWRVCVGYLSMFGKGLKEIESNFSIESLKEFNSHYQFLSDEEVDAMTPAMFNSIISRPSRVCGVVKNEGNVGGGPFWVKNNGGVSKQIVEMAQISNDTLQQKIMGESTHFNPVFIALSKKGENETLLNLEEFVDDTKVLKVKKSQHGKTINYRELPGLWNGSMDNWNTVFIELPKEVFTPVKSVLDLI